MTPGRIELRGLRVLARCGAVAAERAVPQPLEVDLDIDAALATAARSDDLADTVDYAELCSVAVDAVGAEPAALLEHLARRVADALLAADARIDTVVVVVRKLRPPVPHDLASAGVRLVCRRPQP